MCKRLIISFAYIIGNVVIQKGQGCYGRKRIGPEEAGCITVLQLWSCRQCW